MQPTIITIFGVTGDLTERKLLPALYNLMREKKLPKDFYIVGFARRDWTDKILKEHIAEAVQKHVPDYQGNILTALTKKVYYVKGDFSEKADYTRLREFLNSLEKRKGSHINKVFYLATAPSYYPTIFEELGVSGLHHCCGVEESRVLIEKPFGKDAKSASHLNKILQKHFEESQIYRIDHYLGKEPVQNILTFRFGNGIFEHLWNRRYIDNIQISVMEELGVENRAGYYEESGVLLDMVQNHILQLIALICMEEPYSLDPEDIRDKKFEFLRKVHLFTGKQDVVKAQYTGYRNEPKVSKKSLTETFAALKFNINNSRWNGVPIYVRSGKALNKKLTEINIEFKQPRVHFLGETKHHLSANILSIRIQPDEAIALRLMVKSPKFEMELKPAQMNFNYSEFFHDHSPEAYERIIYDALVGSPLLFVRSDSILQQWKIIDKLKKMWHEYPMLFYKRGSAGPVEQDALLQKDGRQWWNLKN